ncbi:hypothetical protein D9599_20795 [Roseomonas sp. KE2513]|nr:hypothetical protein [Roseomonas sp. KE2513]
MAGTMQSPTLHEATRMETSLTEALARSLGLEKALAAHRDDVLAAASRAETIRANLPQLRDPAAEPFPPMCPGPRR